MALTQGDGLILQVRKGFKHLPTQRFVVGKGELLQGDLLLTHFVLDGNAQRTLTIFFVGDSYIDVADQFAHHVRGLLAVLPELSPVVIITRNGHSSLPGRLYSL